MWHCISVKNEEKKKAKTKIFYCNTDPILPVTNIYEILFFFPFKKFFGKTKFVEYPDNFKS